jgi:hypothetical protein
MQETIALNTPGEQPLALRIFAKIISYLFHPLFIPVYIFLWLTWRFPIHFDDITPRGLTFKTISVFLNASFFPAFSVFLLWKLKFIDTIFLRTQKDRIIHRPAGCFKILLLRHFYEYGFWVGDQ